jgi:DNA-binding transcriptional ArsR family regulator
LPQSQDDPLDDVLRRLSKTLGHPLRVKIMNALERDGVASPNELSAKLGEPLSDVAYHTRALRDLGVLEEVRTEQRRGATEHFYRATERALVANPEWERIPRAGRSGISHAIIDLMIGDISAAIEAQTFDELDDAQSTRIPMVVDERGWKETVDVLLAAFERTMEIRDESWARLLESGEEGFNSSVHILHFKTPGGASEDGRQPDL